MAKQRNFWMNRGEDVSFEVTLEGSGSIADQEFRYDLRNSISEPENTVALVTKVTEGGIVIVDPDARTIRVDLSHDDTIGLAHGVKELVCWYEIAQTDEGSNAALAFGHLTIRNRSVRV